MNQMFLPVLIALAWSLMLLSPGHSATLRATSTLAQPQVRIADLFDEAGPAGDRILGPGPVPGSRIVVEAAQAAAIARQFGVSWRPSSNAERVVIDRPGRLVAREEVMAPLRAALVSAGGPADADIELPGYTAPLIPLETAPVLAVEQVEYDPPSGRFTATLSVSVTGEAIQRTRLSGRMQEMVELVVPTRRLAPGAVIRADDLQVARMRAGGGRGDGRVEMGRGEVVTDVSQAIGKAMRRMAAPGQPLPLADIGRPLVVLKGARVMMLLQSPGLSMAAVGVASEPGSIGDTIGVLNPASGAVVDAQIVSADQVRVLPGAVPRLAARSGGAQVVVR